MSIEFNLEMAGRPDDPLEVARGVRRILAGNASQMTFKGTNTYIVGGNELVVIDPGPNDEAHCRAILAAAGKSPITDILITHRHLDHAGGIERLRTATGARVAAFALARSRPRADYQSPSGKEFIAFDLAVDRELADGDRVVGRDFCPYRSAHSRSCAGSPVLRTDRRGLARRAAAVHRRSHHGLEHHGDRAARGADGPTTSRR